MSQQNLHAGRTATLFVVILLSVALFVFLAWLYTGDSKRQNTYEPNGDPILVEDEYDQDNDITSDTPVVTHMGSVSRINGTLVTVHSFAEAQEGVEISLNVPENIETKYYNLSKEDYVVQEDGILKEGDIVGFEVREDVVVSKTHFIE